jgi:hypothetical protein
VVVNMTRAEKQRLEFEARDAGLSLSGYLLHVWRSYRR